MKQHIVVIEDDRDIASNVQHFLHLEGFSTEHAADGAEGLRLVKARNPDAMIVDLGLPDCDGTHLTRVLRGFTRAPIMILTAEDDRQRKIAALDSGADDYLTKPFQPEELIARLHAQLRRTGGPGVLEVGGLTVTTDTRICSLGEQSVQLSPAELHVLTVLSRNPGRIYSHEELTASATAEPQDTAASTLSVQVLKLRGKLEELRWPGRIRTVRGVGYALKVPTLDV